MKKLTSLIISIYITILSSINAEIRNWDARWITHPHAELLNYGVFHFRKTIALSEKPTIFFVNISADNK